jgi:hypothetical protein
MKIWDGKNFYTTIQGMMTIAISKLGIYRHNMESQNPIFDIPLMNFAFIEETFFHVKTWLYFEIIINNSYHF